MTTATRSTSRASQASVGSPGSASLRGSSEQCAGTWSTRSGGARSSRASTGSTTNATTGLSARSLPESTGHPAPVPAKVSRQPAPEPEATLAGGAIAPGRGHLRDLHAHHVGLDGQLEAELEATPGFDLHALQQALGVETEVAGGVVNREASEPVQGQP